MFSLDQKIWRSNSKLTQKIQSLIIGRLLVIFLLLVASWIWNSGRLELSLENFPQGLFFVFLISVGLTIIYFFVVRLNQNYAWQVRIQFFLDSLIITWLVWQTGTATSPYTTLYILLISVASMFLNWRETILTAVICVFLFTGLAVLAAFAVVRPFGMMPETNRLIQIIGFNDVAFLVVGLLAARLSERRASGEQLKEATKKLAKLRALHERIVESIRSGLITTDLEGNIFSFNRAATEITGYQADDMIGRPISDLLGNLERPVAMTFEATGAGDQPPRFETEMVTPDGFGVCVGYHISPLFSEEGETSGLIITFQDLTEIRTMEENFRRKDRLAAVGRVAAGLAHEIRNPLGAMRGAIQLLQSNTPPDSAQASLMDIVLRESDRLNNIISNFLTYARPRVANFSPVDVREAINDTVTLLRHSPDVRANHLLEVNLPEHPVTISADPTQLKQIFWNLARNALQAMPAGGTLKVETETISPNRIKITFSDTGRGMSPEQVEKLFEPFSDSTTGGTGLGLSIVYQIIRDHHGSINVRSLENQGTTITIELPTEYVEQPESAAAPVDENEARASRLENFLTVKD